MSANSKLTLTSLDFDGIKENLKTFLKGQAEFTDFDFEGSTISQLLNLLAYNTHYQGFYLNMVANEMFMDTAVLRKSIVSHAKTLGYTPRSATASMATVNVTITKANSDSTTVLTLPRFTTFASEALNGVSYNFVSVDNYNAANSNNTFTFNDVELKEGIPVSKSFIVDNATNPSQYFSLSDQNIDTSTLQVVVQTSRTIPTQNTFSLAEDATDVDSDANVFYLEETDDGSYRIYFGDDILGRKLTDGNIVIASYITTSGDAANGLRRFRLQSQVLSGSTSNVETAIASTAGSGAESSQSVKFTAPKSYISQNRAVTKNDHINMINRRYPYFDAVTVWGGEENDPPVYGKVFISAKPKVGFAITQAEKQHVIQNVLMPVGILTVIPEFVDPDYNYLNFRIRSTYDSKLTSSTAAQLQTIISDAVAAYAEANLNTFNNSFKLSKFLRAVDDSDPSIESSTASIFLEKRFNPILETSTTYTIKFGTPLHKGIGSDRLYSSPSFTQEDGTGIERNCFIEEVPESSTGVESIRILDPGRNFVATPTLTIVGDGQGANAYARIVNGKIQSVVVDNPGTNYTTATIAVSGGGGVGGQLEAVIQGATGRLRTYYFDQNNNKIILDPEAGTIDYVNGIVSLDSFAPIDVANPFKRLSIYIQPANFNFSSTLNRILTYDDSDPGAITISLKDDE